MKKATRHSVKNISLKHDIGRTNARRPLLEALESRQLLSGSVLASVVHGMLNIRGDSAANVVVLDQTGLAANQVRVSGLSGTAINKQTNPVILSGITHGAQILMGNATDSVTLSNLTVRGALTVNGGQGANTLTFDNVHVTQSLSIQNGSRLSTVALADTTAGKNLTIQGGSGGQSVTLRAVDVRGKTAITSSGKGPVIMAIDDSTFHGAAGIRTGNGADIIQLDSRGASQGSPTVFHGPLTISTNGGNDALQVGVPSQTGNRNVFSGKVTFDGGAGFDTLRNFDTATNTGKRFRIKHFESRITDSVTIAPTVSSTNPANSATGVALNRKIAATFSTVMDPLTITTANVTVTAPGHAAVTGTVAYVGTTMTFTPTTPLAANTVYTLTIATGAKDLAGTSLAGNFVSTFTTGATADTTAPTVTSTSPSTSATGVALNQKIAATFSEAMDPSTVVAANVTVTAPGPVAVAGSVAYVGTTMTFTPTNPLAANTVYTLKISTGAKDLAGNPLATTFVSSFTTGATADTTAPTVSSTSPRDLQTNVVINKTIAATFSKPIDALTLTTTSFKLTGPGSANVAGTVNYDAASMIATFSPSSNLAPNTTYTATIKGGANGVKDLAGNPLAIDKVWTFTTGTQVAQAPINLGSASTFAVMATASTGGTGPDQINGDVGLNPGSAQGISPAQINGSIHVDDQAIITAQSDLRAAYHDAVSRSLSSVSLPGNMGGLTFTPGLYTNSTSVLIQGAGPNNNVTLDAQGDPNAIFIFQMGSTLTTGPGAQVILAGGAKASNIFWQVGTSATLDTTTIFKGNVLAGVTITVNSGSVVEGRLLGGSSSDGSVTVNASTVTVPAA